MIVKKYSAASIFFLVLCVCFAEDGKDKVKSRVDAWRETLRYGITDQILDVINQVKEAEETGLNKELTAVFTETVSDAVKTEILAFFTDKNYSGVQAAAEGLLDRYENLDPDLVVAAIKYLTVFKNQKLSVMTEKLIGYDNDKIRSQAIRSTGEMKDSAREEMLLAKLADDEFPQKFKPEIVLALGDLGGKKSVERMISLLENTDSDHTIRVNACQALGKLKDPAAVPILKKQLASNDALLKSYAISALGSFDLDETYSFLIEGLKDNNWRVRVQSAKGLARKGNTKAIEILIYKAKQDPEKPVKMEALKSIGEIQDAKGFDFLREIYGNDLQPMDVRELCLSYLVKYDLAASANVIQQVVAKEWNMKRMPGLEMTAKLLSKTNSSELADVLKKMLSSNNFIIRIYGIRGIGRNRMTGLKGELEKLAREDPAEAVKREAAAAAAGM